ncbi:MAG: polysaccharide deacetylase family protein [Nitrososphaerota archaeon]
MGTVLILIVLGSFPIISGIYGSQNTNNKVVVINFDDGRKTQFTLAKPILDKYGFKATFYVVCNYADNKKGYMTWEEIETLDKEGHDIGSHSMRHVHLSNLTKKDIQYEIGNSKKCLQDHGIQATSFAYPFNDGANVKKVTSMVSKYYELARTANDPLTYLGCRGLDDLSIQSDCKISTDKQYRTYGSKFTISGWSHDFSRIKNSYDEDAIFKKFTEVVNSQVKYNDGGSINAIPIIIYHRVGEPSPGYSTDLNLFEKEMRYLYNNGFTALRISDLTYDNKVKEIFIKQFEEKGVSGKIADAGGSK